MTHPLLRPKTLAILGIDSLSENDQLYFLTQHGDTIFTAALSRFEPLLSDPEQLLLSDYLETNPEPEDLLDFLLNEFDTFAPIVQAVLAESIADSL